MNPTRNSLLAKLIESQISYTCAGGAPLGLRDKILCMTPDVQNSEPSQANGATKPSFPNRYVITWMTAKIPVDIT